MNNSNRLPKRIRKLMSLVTQNNDLNEITRALRLAQKLILRHSILEQEPEISSIRESICRRVPSDAVSIPGWLNGLAAVVCMATGCSCWFDLYSTTTRYRRMCLRRSVHFYGFSGRSDIAAYLFKVLSQQLREATERHIKDLPRLKPQIRRIRTDQFREGWVGGVWSALESFTPSEREDQLLKTWLRQRCGKNALSPSPLYHARKDGALDFPDYQYAGDIHG
ncbi:DUF7168 domain-containing protein [Brenneria izbisi]|uniref:DUF2786 domain-containing protein n=1 Tax=Brenneria izbisi TaxID=2939450 RepID=A0AA41XXQ1_9GAMM|nr:DUF2786 domain-containing protein [Brenneria izbisi]MCV9879298.1 DUF2786 domain-containing protein [Brenneria izbisi]MCV9883866.1 DUF2786 domain-containing protein [Brenneria izbisi]